MTLLDTAGVRASDDPVEQEGIRRAMARAAAADLVLWVIDSQVGQRPTERCARKARGSRDLAGAPTRSILLWIMGMWEQRNNDRIHSLRAFDSSATGAGIDALITAFSAHAQIISRQRKVRWYRVAPRGARGVRRKRIIPCIRPEELIAEELRAARHRRRPDAGRRRHSRAIFGPLRLAVSGLPGHEELIARSDCCAPRPATLGRP